MFTETEILNIFLYNEATVSFFSIIEGCYQYNIYPCKNENQLLCNKITPTNLQTKEPFIEGIYTE